MRQNETTNDLLNKLSDATDLIACSASHELNNIFMGISCYLDILMQQHSIAEGASKELLRIKEALRQAQLITGKLGLLAGTRDSVLESESYENLTQCACSMIRKGLKRHGIHLVETYDAPKPKFPGKISVFVRFMTGIVTLLMDCLQNTQSREIHVCLTHPDNHVVITVSAPCVHSPDMTSLSLDHLPDHDPRIDYYSSLCEAIGGQFTACQCDDGLRFEAVFEGN